MYAVACRESCSFHNRLWRLEYCTAAAAAFVFGKDRRAVTQRLQLLGRNLYSEREKQQRDTNAD